MTCQARLTERFALDAATGDLRFVGVMTAAERDELRQLATAAPYRSAIDALFAAGNAYQEPDEGNRFLTASDADLLFFDARSVNERFRLVQRRLLPHLRARASEELVSATLGDAVSLPPEATREILAHHLAWPGRLGSFALGGFLDPRFAADAATDLEAAFPDQLAALVRLHKLALLVARLGVQPLELFTLLGEKDWAWVNDLPVVAAASSPFRYAGWRRLVELVALRERLPAGGDVLAAVFAAADAATDPGAVRGVLSKQLGWDAADLTYATAGSRLAFQAPADFRDPERLAELAAVFEALRLIGASAEQGWAFAADEPAESDALVIRRVVRAALGDAGWFERARALRDALRERQRAALVARLVARDHLRDPSELFDRYLIDVEIDPCALTSRVRQAIGSVQLFVQRCLMGLEPDVPACAIPADQWQWLKSYRVWEANRRVFLYPENWLDPELRDDKTEAFRQLTSSIQQGDLNDDAATRAFGAFLEQLELVARLEVMGACREPVADGELLHVVARTFNTPHTYFYRRRTEAGAWTGWERIDLDIQGNHVIPVVWKRRLFVFWAKLTQQANEPEPDKIPEKGEKPHRYWEVKLAWSEHKADRWGATQELTEPMPASLPINKLPDAVLLGPQPSDDALTVSIGYPAQSGNAVVWTWQFARLTAGQGRLAIEPKGAFNLHGYFTPNGAPAGTELSSNALIEQSTTGQLPLVVSSGAMGPQGLDRWNPTPMTVLNRQPKEKPNRFRLVFPLGAESFLQASPGQLVSLVAQDGFFFEDRRRTYLASYSRRVFRVTTPGVPIIVMEGLLFEPHFHPWAAELAARLNTGGLRQLLSPATQRLTDSGTVTLPSGQTLNLNDGGVTFWRDYAPSPEAVWPDLPPKENIDFDARGAYATYNWELFFHAPFLIAQRLSSNQRFAEAQRWFHLIFDPTDDSSDPEPGRYWRTQPFREASRAAQIQQLLEILAAKDPNSPTRQELVTQVNEWRLNPFRPHAVARWRTSAYQRAVVMAYIDNLIAWGDQLFRRDTPETVNEATQLYVLAASILGPPPERIPRRLRIKAETYTTLEPKLDELSNALVELEGVLPAGGGSDGGAPTSVRPGGPAPPPPPLTHTLYFCVPHNPQLLDRWARVADRLFKVRHCMNIEGVVRELPLFDSPIDPGLLVQASAAGVDLGAALSDMDAALPAHRFSVLAQKATELCADVRSLGAALLSALERRDAEALALLRSTHEINVLAATRTVRLQQLEEAKAEHDALSKSLELAKDRLTYYTELLSATRTITIPPPGGTSLAERIGRALRDQVSSLLQESVGARATLQLAELVAPEVSRAVEEFQRVLSLPVQPTGPAEKVTLPLSGLESRQLEELVSANQKQQLAMDYDSLAQILALIPDFTIGVEGFASSPTVQAQLGGTLLSTHARLQASGLNAQASDLSSRANLHAILAGHERRADEWRHQGRQTLTEIEQIGKQMVAATYRVAVATQELHVHDVQASNARAEDSLMRDKFTNEELCDWLVAQISSVYLAGYQLAYDVAKRAERAYRHELGVRDSSFINFGYWDGLRKGLLAGERLSHDLKRMDVSYLELDQREHELTRHVSLAQLDPGALIRLKITGACEFELPEALFDLDRPGHYRRRIKSVSLSIPCVTGPFTGVHCTLTLLRSSERINASLEGGYLRSTDSQTGGPADDTRFLDAIALESIVTSSGQDQYGLFEPSLGDARRLPFELRGAISRWRLELPATFRQFDYSTIANAVLHVRYTARDEGRRLADAAVGALRDGFNELLGSSDGTPRLARLFSLRHEFPGWSQLVSTSGDRTLKVEIADRFPLLLRGRRITVAAVDILLRDRPAPPGQENRAALTGFLSELRRATFDGKALDKLAPWSGRDDLLSAHHDQLNWDPTDKSPILSFQDVPAVAVSLLEDVWLVCHYEVEIH